VAGIFAEAGCAGRRSADGPPSAKAQGRSGHLSLRPADRQEDPVEIGILRVELVLGIWIGAVTFTGSVIAYGKLAGKPAAVQDRHGAKQLPGGHMLNAAAAACRCSC
jgi:NAD(P) transhydrogenase subunit beta